MLSEEMPHGLKSRSGIPESGWETTYCGMEDSVMLNGREQYLILLSEKLIDAGGQSGTRNDRISAQEEHIRQSLDFDRKFTGVYFKWGNGDQRGRTNRNRAFVFSGTDE